MIAHKKLLGSIETKSLGGIPRLRSQLHEAFFKLVNIYFWIQM